MGIDIEGLLYLFNRHTTELVSSDALIAEGVAHEIEAGHMRAALLEALEAGVLEWAPGAHVRRPA